MRYRVSSLAFKGEDDPAGVPVTWIVTAPAARAITVLERLQPDDGAYLFAVLPSSPMFPITSPDDTKTAAQTNKDLAALVGWINEYCGSRGRADGIPPVNGMEWNLTTRQFRRTLAWFIARRPGGVIAGAIQYRHTRVRMFEGYAGTSESGFRAEVEAEETIARGEMLGDIITDHGHHRLAGPAAAEAEARLEAFEKTVRFDGKVITDRKRMQRFMARNDPRIYPGQFVTCSDNPERRLCQLGDKALPSLGDCQPMLCRNAAFTEDNRASWRERKGELEAELGSGEALAPLYRIAVETKLDEVDAFLAAHDSGAPARQAAAV